MVAGVYVEVPEQLADSLITDGFRRSGFRRGIDPVAAISAGANLVTIFVARHEIVRSSRTFGGQREVAPLTATTSRWWSSSTAADG
jgi:hypothetical protein